MSFQTILAWLLLKDGIKLKTIIHLSPTIQRYLQNTVQWARRRWLILGLAFAVLVIGAAGYLGYRATQAEASNIPEAPPTVLVERGEVLLSVTAPGQLSDAGEAAVLSEVNGPLDQILVQAGDPVTAGQILAKIGDHQKFEVAVSDARAELAKAQADLDALDPAALLSQAHIDFLKAEQTYEDAQNKRLGLQYGRASESTMEIARASYILAADELEKVEEEWSFAEDRPVDDSTRAQALSMLGAARAKRDTALTNLNWVLSKPDANEVAEVDAEMELARINVEIARKKYENMQNGHYPQLDETQAALVKAQAGLDLAKDNLKALDVHAPFDGIITKVNIKAGQNVTDGMDLFTLIDPMKLEVSATIVEEDLQLIKTGQEAQLFFDALPEANITGHLDRLVPQRVNNDRVIYPIFITLDEIPPGLVSGMTVDASITIEKKENVLRLPRSLVHARSDGSAELSVWDGEQVVKRTIEIGLRGDSYVEILSGLEEGDQVVSK